MDARAGFTFFRLKFTVYIVNLFGLVCLLGYIVFQAALFLQYLIVAGWKYFEERTSRRFVRLQSKSVERQAYN